MSVNIFSYIFLYLYCIFLYIDCLPIMYIEINWGQISKWMCKLIVKLIRFKYLRHFICNNSNLQPLSPKTQSRTILLFAHTAGRRFTEALPAVNTVQPQYLACIFWGFSFSSNPQLMSEKHLWHFLKVLMYIFSIYLLWTSWSLTFKFSPSFKKTNKQQF